MEGGHSLAEHAGQLARVREDALVTRCEALDQCEIRLRHSDYVADANRFRPAVEHQSSGATAHGLEVSATRERVGDLVQMRL